MWQKKGGNTISEDSMVRCKHEWDRCFRFLPRQTHWCLKCGTWRITLDEDCQKPGYKFRYFRPSWMKKPTGGGIRIGRYSVSMFAGVGGEVHIEDVESGEGMQSKIETLEKTLSEFWEKEF